MTHVLNPPLDVTRQNIEDVITSDCLNEGDSTLPLETFNVGQRILPKLFNGLWQLSSSEWGVASFSEVLGAMKEYADAGYTAFADHYGTSEITYGKFIEHRKADESRVFGATKWCVFRSLIPSREVVQAAVNERLKRLGSKTVDLLQFHWKDYDDREGYMMTLKHLMDLKEEGLIENIGLCNFNAEHMDYICSNLPPGTIVTNQVAFSLIDQRPRYKMFEICKKHGVKLLTYGTLCGGLFSDRWLNVPEDTLLQDSYGHNKLTPSSRKYLDVIYRAWGTWPLFQELLQVLRNIGDRHNNVSIANVAIRWVLDHDYVGAVIIGARLGVSEHILDNKAVFSFHLTEQDRNEINAVLDRSNAAKIIETLGDCGAEYRGL